MSAEDVERLEQDLSTFRQLLKVDQPFDRGDILPVLVIGLGALAALPMLAMQMFVSPRICLLVCLAPGVLLYIRRYMAVNRQRSDRPNLWREYRVSAVAVVLFPPAAVGWIWWSSRYGLTRTEAAAPLMFCMGFAAFIVGIVDASRRSYAVVGAGVVAFGICIPLIAPAQIPFVGAAVLAAISLMMSVWIFVATRHDVQPGTGADSE